MTLTLDEDDFRQQSLEFQGSLSSSRPFLPKIGPALWKQRKRATSKPRTLWAIKTLTPKSGPRQ